MKKIGLIFVIVIVVVGIYFRFNDNKVLYVNIGDAFVAYGSNYEKEVIDYLKGNRNFENYVEYSKENHRITDFINDINGNKTYHENKTLKNLLIKADLITIWVGNNDINYKIVNDNETAIYEYLDGLLEDTSALLELIRKNSKEQILIMGIYNLYGKEKQEYFDYYNQKLKVISQKYNMEYINSDSLLSQEHFQNKYLNEKGSKVIGQKILKNIKY